MFIRDSVWREISDNFTADEIATIQSAVKGRIVAPTGAEVDIDRLEAGLADRLVELIHGRARQRGA